MSASPGYREPQFNLIEAAAKPAASAPSGTTPIQIRHAYGIDNITFADGTKGNGSNTTIAIIDAYDAPNIENDLGVFDQAFSLSPPPSFRKVNQTGGSNLPSPPPVNDDWSLETSLDVEWAHAVAPNANILLVEANNSSDANLLAAVDFARSQLGVVAISMSFGGPESRSQLAEDAHYTAPAGHANIVLLASSGDNGSPASYPSSSPNVLSVGGTKLVMDNQGNRISETGWTGSGGGQSLFESRPSWQVGKLPDYRNRLTPDIAYNSDPATGYPVFDSFRGSNWVTLGGTSAASPQWAGLVAILDQGLQLAGKATMSNAALLPQLYNSLSSDLNDITSGKSTGVPNQTCKTGYDLVTGMGTPKADLLIAGLIAAAPAAIVKSTSTVSAATSPGNSSSFYHMTFAALAKYSAAENSFAGTQSDNRRKLPFGQLADAVFAALAKAGT
jgi:subtilase family serine protease